MAHPTRTIDDKTLRVEGMEETLRARYCYVTIDRHSDFGIYASPDQEDDPITEAVLDETYVLPQSFWLVKALLEPSEIVLDLGAHIGTFSLFAAALGHPVVAVEPSPRSAALLNESARRNGFQNLRVIRAAVSDHAGAVGFVRHGPYGYVANGPTGSGPDRATLTVSATTVDRLLAEIGCDTVGFIKMDVEGSEVAAIRGMAELLNREDAPWILYESNGHTLSFFGETPASLLGALERLGYRSYLVDSRRLIPTRSTDLQPEVCVDYLAAKRPLDALDDWRVVAPVSDEERIERILLSSTNPNPKARAYLARALVDADPALLSDPRVVRAVDGLRLDHDEDAFVVALRQALCEKEAEIARLREQVAAYERGRFIRTMRALHDLWRSITGRARDR